ncbi:DNA gyrase inhibitor YacG [Roseibium aquae]|uniref:DNA gyrase inhibitor YacG n=1 Tax=Roseibium aquae TaxID=1323746 RepID=A0A916X253_9HYPH|nr:DNA gyrase inhibitor YacG [Roseibium aquae]GGB49352.1 DNA gyrase inhibitor YacG [Roseibium aquae]
MSEETSSSGRRMRPCPICSKLSTPDAYPFCSKRCADIDLHRWFNESYTVPVVETDDIEDPEDPK